MPLESIASAVASSASLFATASSKKSFLEPAFRGEVDIELNRYHILPYTHTYQVIQKIRGFLFQPCYHPYMEKVLEKLNEEGFESIFGLLDATDGGAVFSRYQPNTATTPPLVQLPLPEERFYFDINKPYAQDNWITFYHIIVFIVETLLANNKIDEAIVWIENCLYDPKAIESEPDPLHPGENAKYWKLPIFKDTPVESTTKFFKDINNQTLQDLVNDLQANPFNPFVVAYRRPQEFMMYVVNLYAKAHIAKGDINFRMAYNGGGMDYLNLALEYYKVAKIQLGERPETVPNLLKKKPETYQSLKDKGLRPDVNALVQYENMLPFCSQNTLETGDAAGVSLLGGGPAFYFSIPPDTATLALFDLIDDRMGKLRSCRDIDGNLRKIDLFGTPINPSLILSALAKGLSLGQILGSMYAPAPAFRFGFMFQKALEACNDAKVLGETIVNAIARQNDETLALMRATHDTEVLNSLTTIKERQVYEARLQKQNLLKVRESTMAKMYYYESLLGISDHVDLYKDLPQEVNSESILPTTAIVCPTTVDVDVTLVDSAEKGVKIIPKEQQEIKSLEEAASDHSSAGDLEQTATEMQMMPGFSINVSPFGVGVGTSFGGSNVAAEYSGRAKGYQNDADKSNHDAALAAKLAGYIRRESDWTFQVNTCKNEIPPLDFQLSVADLKIQIAAQELENHRNQVAKSLEIQNYLATKESNGLNYQEIIEIRKPMHKSYYDLAMYFSRCAEQAYKLEKPEKEVDFIAYDFDNSITGCATAAEKLHLSLKQMEKSYLEDCRRPKEMKKTISLMRLDPVAMMRLRKEGKTTFRIPEWLLLLDNRGIYNAKWLSVNFSFPMIVGPNNNFSARVSMVRNYIRTKTTGVGSAAEFAMKTGADGTDNRFVQSNTPFREIIVSTGMNDNGVNLDPSSNVNETYQQQYLPFQHAGFISEWSIDLNQKDADHDYSQVNWNTLSDLLITGILSVDTDYGQYAAGAGKYLEDIFKKFDREQPFSLFNSIKNDYPNDFHRFEIATNGTPLSFSIDKSRFPYIAQHHKITVKEIEVSTKSGQLADNAFGEGLLKFEIKQSFGGYTVFNARKWMDGTDINMVVTETPVVYKLKTEREIAADTFINFKYILEKNS